jgi:hypothetical protein
LKNEPSSINLKKRLFGMRSRLPYHLIIIINSISKSKDFFEKEKKIKIVELMLIYRKFKLIYFLINRNENSNAKLKYFIL